MVRCGIEMINKILVVDDNHNNLRLLKDILEDENYIVYTTDNSLSVIDIACNLKPDLILLDIMMPNMDGFELCQQIKSNSEINEIPIIMVTAKSEGLDLKNAFDLGAVDYIKKPFDEIEVIARIQSVLRLKQNQDTLKEKASKDGLTGVYNHALLIELFEKEYLRAIRAEENISFVMIDIDHFKLINDTYGHTGGDFILQELVKILSGSIRENDFVGRYGGEEFSIVLGNTTNEDTYTIGERIRRNVENHTFMFGEQNIHITISMGYYYKTSKDQISFTDMIKLADEALYEAKQSGRNKIIKYC
jgi:two-component system, cell cycle response regulator